VVVVLLELLRLLMVAASYAAAPRAKVSSLAAQANTPELSALLLSRCSRGVNNAVILADDLAETCSVVAARPAAAAPPDIVLMLMLLWL
jgi:hypothetical protein